MNSLRHAIMIFALAIPLCFPEDKAPAKPDDAKTVTPASAKTPEPAAPAGPQKVYVGMYVNDIFGVSLADYKFEADFYIWFRWQGSGLKPLATFQTANGRINKKDGVIEKKIGDWNYASCRVTAVFQAHWDLHRFPFDKQVLALEIEDNESDVGLLQYIPDTENIAIDPEVRLPGWLITGSSNEVKQHKYTTNYGDTSLPSGAQSVWSRFALNVNATRPGIGYFFKLCWGLLIAMLIALVPMFLKPTDGPRFGLGTGAMFAAMANAFVISNALPKDAGLTTADLFFSLALTAIFITLCQSLVSLKMFTSGNVAGSARLDKITFRILLAAYIVGTTILIVM